MEKLKTATFSIKVSHLLSGSFPGAAVKVHRDKPLQRYHWLVIWDGFEGVEQVDRQAQVWKLLRANLSQDEQSKISAVLTMAPVER